MVQMQSIQYRSQVISRRGIVSHAAWVLVIHSYNHLPAVIIGVS